jgi:hypothetical protein
MIVVNDLKAGAFSIKIGEAYAGIISVKDKK